MSPDGQSAAASTSRPEVSETPDGTGPGRIPGLRYVDHAAFTVPDLDQAVAFFVQILGAQELYRSQRGGDRPFMVTNFEVDPNATLELSMLRLDPNLNIELFEWSAPDQRTDLPRPSDLGGHHVCLYVDDVSAACRHLRTVSGVRVLGEPKKVRGDGPVAGTTWTYFLTPWGMLIELVNRANVRPLPEFIGQRNWVVDVD